MACYTATDFIPISFLIPKLYVSIFFITDVVMIGPSLRILITIRCGGNLFSVQFLKTGKYQILDMHSYFVSFLGDLPGFQRKYIYSYHFRKAESRNNFDVINCADYNYSLILLDKDQLT